MQTKLALSAILCGAAIFNTTAQADIIVSGTQGQAGGSVVITTDITFKIQTAGSISLFILEENVPSYDGALDVAPFQPGAVLSYRINDGNTQTTSLAGSNLADNFGGSFGALGPNDGYAGVNLGFVNVGDKITLLAQTLPLASIPVGFNPDALGRFAGRALLANASAVQLSEIISVNRSTRYAEIAVELYSYYAGMNQANLGLSAFYDSFSLSRYYFHLDSAGDQANAEFNLYFFKGRSLKYFYLSQGKPKLGRYFQFLNLARAHKRFWTLKGNPRKGQQLYVKYRTIALAARR